MPGRVRATMFRRTRQDGAVAVEFALVLPLLVMLLMGVTTAGLAYNQKLALTNAVREGARFGATLTNDSNWASGVVARTKAVHFESVRPLQDSELCAQLVLHSGAVSPAGSDTVEQETSGCTLGAPPATPDGVLPGECVVKIWAEKRTELNALFISWEIGLDAASVSYYERKPCVVPVTP